VNWWLEVEVFEKRRFQGDRFTHRGDVIVAHPRPPIYAKGKTTRKIGREKEKAQIHYLSCRIAAFPNGTREHSGY